MIIDINTDDCIENNLIIDPITKENVTGFIIKDNTTVSFNLANRNIVDKKLKLRSYYYRNINNKNVIIRSLDCDYVTGSDFYVIPNHTYKYLKSTNRLNDRLFVISIDYEIKKENSSEIISNNKKYYFKLVNNKEFDAYKKLENDKKIDINIGKNGEIIRPK